MRKWAMWMPVLMIASLMFWTLALGLGGLSLMAFGVRDVEADDLVIVPGTCGADESGTSAVPVDLVEETPEPPPADPGPGATAF